MILTLSWKMETKRHMKTFWRIVVTSNVTERFGIGKGIGNIPYVQFSLALYLFRVFPLVILS
jgi:hypothetical protein